MGDGAHEEILLRAAPQAGFAENPAAGLLVTRGANNEKPQAAQKRLSLSLRHPHRVHSTIEASERPARL